MTLDVLTALEDRICAIMKTECRVYILDYHNNISGFLTDMNTQAHALKDHSSLSFIDWLNSRAEGGFVNYQRTLCGLLFLLVILNILCSFLLCFSVWSRGSFTAVTSSQQMILSAQEDSHVLSTLDTYASVLHNSY